MEAERLEDQRRLSRTSSGNAAPRLRSVVAASTVSVAAALSIAMWTAIPLIWIWIASQAAGTQFPRLLPYLLCLGGTVISMILVGALVARLGRVHDRLRAHQKLKPGRTSLFESLGEERIQSPPTVVEQIFCFSIALALIASAVWFIFFAGSPLWA